ncbi:MAG: polysaccharide pyruvyl transferase family protein [candidate division SR1 bacterium]|nr:polysaccharide pyruvyl transferase family protein [candidate division SR1 bacterium]
MEGYLRGYYGYKNFGDELLFFGVVKRLFINYPLTKLFVEVGNASRMEDWVRENYQGLLTEKQLNAIKFVSAKQHKYKIVTHLINFLGRGKYKKAFKFFGGGEVLSDERSFPHDGRSLPILFNYSVRKGQFALLGGIGKIRKGLTKKLYTYLLPKAEKIAVRDRESFAIGKSLNQENTILYQDFAQEIIENIKHEGKTVPTKYILVNINKQSVDVENIKKIIDFCAKYPDHKKIFFPCDMNDDKHCFLTIKKYISGLELYDRTKNSLPKSLSLFYNADAGIGARLHFLLPLKLYKKIIVAIPYADKINKLITKK